MRPAGSALPQSWAVAAAAVAAASLRLPGLRSPLSADEGGFLLVGGQWHTGLGSLYGAYWVDRPPLLVAIFGAAHLLGGPVALRLIGCLAAVATVLLGAALGRCVGGARAQPWAALAALGFVSTPLFGAQQVSGELLAVPFVLGGVLAFLTARHRPDSDRRWLLLVLAGVSGAAALLVKQNFVEVVLFALVVSAADAVAVRSWLVLRDRLVPFGLGLVATVAVAVGLAATRGTSPQGLWDATVVFRVQASQVIATSASSATADRLARYPLALLLSGAVFLVALLGVRVVRSGGPDPVTWGVLALLGWELTSALAGGSYWLTYLLGLVPGLVLAAAVVARRRDPARRGLVVLLIGVAAFSVAAVVQQSVATASPSPSVATANWLQSQVDPGDTAVVAFGQANILATAHVSSPYPNLWSLPVRVRDPHLRELAEVLDGPRAPDWLLVWRQLSSWGIQPGRAEVAVRHGYHRVADVCGYVVYLRDGVHRPHSVTDLPASCAVGAGQSGSGQVTASSVQP